MAWTDKPTDNQINALMNLIRWEITREDMPKINAYLVNNTTRKEVSEELGRLRMLKMSRKMNRDTAFAGAIWNNYEH